MTREAALGWFFAMSTLLFACGGDDSSSAVPKVPTLRLTSLTSSDGSVWQAGDGDAQLTLPCDGRIVVGVEVENWSERAPGACGQAQSCGHTEAIATNESGATSYGYAISNPLLKLPTSALADWVGQSTLLVRLVRDDNSPYLDPAGEEISDTVNVSFSATSDCTSPGGSPSSDGSSGAGGASNEP